MKAIFFLIISICIASLGFSQNVNIPDPNFKNYLLSTPVNTDLDFEISVEEANAFTGLLYIVNTPTITDLTGIEEFHNLRWLRCISTSLTSIDLSNNTALEQLWIPDNTLLTNIDLSVNTALEELWVSNTPLTSLDVSVNTALRTLIYANITFLNLDLSTNINLTRLNVENSALTNLNIANGNNLNFDVLNSNFTNNPNLNCIQVDDFTYANANWSALKDAIASYSTNCSTLSVGEVSLNNSVSIYPNPTTSILNIEMSQNLKQVQIFTLLGKKILETNNTVLNLSNVLSGVYILKVENTEGKIAVRKIVKE